MSGGDALSRGSARDEAGAVDLGTLGALTDAISAGAGLPAVVRAASRALGASLILTDRSGAVIAVAAKSPADERSLLREGEEIRTIELRVADTLVGRLRMRAADAPTAGEPLLALLSTLIASEVERVHAPERASEEAAAAFVRQVVSGEADDGVALLAATRELGLELGAGAGVLVIRAHARSATDDDWRARLLALTRRGARAAASAAIAAPLRDDAAEVLAIFSDADGESGRRVGAAVLRELESGLPGFAFALGRSRRIAAPADLRRACDEALLAVNVVEGDPEREEMAFESAGTYQLLLPHMRDPAELQRFYDETVRPLVAYDEQYETDLLGTLSTFLDCDASVNATAARLITHRHTVRYRFERVRELTGLDVQSTDGREKLSLGLKAMRVLGIAPPRGPASEPGAEGGRVPR
jgi:sugar diacid utilization regulator